MRKYLVKRAAGFDPEGEFQKICDQLSKEGWILQEFHLFAAYAAGLIAVFYKDEE